MATSSNVRVLVGIRGRRACFSNPSAGKINKFSYPFITVSAARGVVASVFHRPQMDWVPTRIAVMRAGRSANVASNEIDFDLSSTDPVFADEARMQVSARILVDVDYIIEAEPVVLCPGTTDDPNTPEKYAAQFNRILVDGKGLYYSTPCLGPRQYVGRLYPVERFPERGCAIPDLEVRSMLVGISKGADRRDGGRDYPVFADIRLVDGIFSAPRFVSSMFNPGESA
jgi:CRISPR-associated protein Cas5d